MSNKSNTKNKITFSVVDFAVIVIGIALIVGIVVRYDIVDKLFSKTSLIDAKVTFVAEAITPEEAAAFTENKKFYTDKDIFGTLSTVSEPAKALTYRENSDGTLVSYEHDTLLDIRGSFTCKVIESKSGYLLGGNRYIAAGSVFTVKADGVAVKITVLSIEELN